MVKGLRLATPVEMKEHAHSVDCDGKGKGDANEKGEF